MPACATIVENKTEVVEVGLYNLTNEEVPAWVHFGPDRTEQMLPVRLKKPGEAGGSSNN